MAHNNEIETLELFVSRIDRMKQYKLSETLLSEFVTSFTVAYDLKKSPEWTYPQLPLDERDAFALSLRLFMQNNDEISIGRISELINKLPLPEKFKTTWNDDRKNFNDYLDSSPERVVEVKSKRELIETILYGDLAHVSKKYREHVKLFNTDRVSGPPAYAEFFSCLREILRYLLSFQKGASLAIKMLST